MLVNTVGNFTNRAPFAGTHIMCHGATVFWLYSDEFGSPPTLQQFTAPAMSPPDPIVRSMLRYGQHLQNATALTSVAPGSVLVFVENSEPKHSCVALAGHRIGGYNQTGWFTTNGVAGGYSVHNMSEVMWLTGLMQRGQVRGSHHRMHCKLYAIPEGVAKAALRQAVQFAV
jgi:hypothetical protein